MIWQYSEAEKRVPNLKLCMKFEFISRRRWKQILLFDSITKINCIEGGILCPRVQRMTFKTNRGLNFIKKIYYNESAITFPKAYLINSVLRSKIEISATLFFVIMTSVLHFTKIRDPGAQR